MATPPTDPSGRPDTVSASRLNDLRTRLDAVDTGIHRLLRERFEIVEEIGATKGPDESIIRPAREAAVIENRLALHSGAMPRDMLAHLWRTLITAACTVQRPFAVHTAHALDAALFLYGPIAVATFDTAAAAVAALGPNDVAVVREEDDWWRGMDGVDARPSVIGRCPMSDGRAVLVIAGSGVSPGAGPDAAVLREGKPLLLPANSINGDDIVVGRYHTFPLCIPAARTS